MVNTTVKVCSVADDSSAFAMKDDRQEPIVSNDTLRLKIPLLDVSETTMSSFCSDSMSGDDEDRNSERDASAATGEPAVLNTGANPNALHLAAFRRTRNGTIVAPLIVN
mmetsp:Transcript_24857/g.41018  ORF Transcript_24857/g.41018 Transcript_24857/m.41018 type:complete len:109 (+) Transcript_24857:580-906(+)